MAAQNFVRGQPLYISRAQNIAKAATSEVIDLTGASPEPPDKDEKNTGPESGKPKQPNLKEEHLKTLFAQQYPHLNLGSTDSVPASGNQRAPIRPYWGCGHYVFDHFPPSSENDLSATYGVQPGGPISPKQQASPSPSDTSQSSAATVGTPATGSITSTAVTDDAEGKEWVDMGDSAGTAGATDTNKANGAAEAKGDPKPTGPIGVDGTTNSPSPTSAGSTPSSPTEGKQYIYALLIEYRYNTNHGGPPLGPHDEFGTLKSVTLKGLYSDLGKANEAVKEVFESVCHRTGLSEVDALHEVDKGKSGGERLFVYLDHPKRFVSWSIYTEERMLR